MIHNNKDAVNLTFNLFIYKMNTYLFPPLDT
jgi:hypothetical protein